MPYPTTAAKLVAEIRAIQTSLNLKDAAFCAGGPIAASTWYQIVAEIYPWPRTDAAAGKLLARLRALKDHAAEHGRRAEAVAVRAKRQSANPSFVEFDEYRAVKAAISRCKAKGVDSEERLVVYVAPTRTGKTWTCDRLMSEGIGTWRVNGTPSWRKNYMAMLRGLSSELRISDRLRSCPLAEGLVLDKLRAQSGVLLIEEIQLLSRDGQSLVKTLLNETPITIVLFMTPGFHRLMLRDAGEDLRQLLGRAEATIIASAVSAAHVEALSEARGLAWPDSSGPEILAQVARDLGGLSAISRMLSHVVRHGAATATAAAAAAKAYRRQVPLPATR